MLRSGGRGPMTPRMANNNNPVAWYAPPPPAYAATVFVDGVGHPAVSALPKPQVLDQDLPHAAGWGPSLDLPLLPERNYAAAFGTPEHQAPLNAPWPRNEIPVPSVQRPADKQKTAPSSGCDAGEGSSRSKKRGNREANARKVILVLAEDPTPPDSWAWRKYGEKSIRDTPYNRSYYRCSTDRNCIARKQVQRCSTQTSFLAVSYIGEHNHPLPVVRNCQAGTTHQKPPLRQPTSPFIRIPSRENQPQALAPPTATPPFAKIPAAQGQQQTLAPPASALASLLSVSATTLGIKHVEHLPQAWATALAPSASPMMSPATLLRSPYAELYKEGDGGSRPTPLVCNCLVCTTRQKTPLLLPPSSVIETPSRESQPQAPAPLLVPVPYSLSTNTMVPPSPLLVNIPAVEEQQQTPALPASASASLSSNTPLPPMPPLLSFQAEEGPTQVPVPALAPSVSTLMSPSMLLPPPSIEFDYEEDDDAIDIRMLLNDMDMTPDDALMFVNPEEEPPLDGAGDDLLIPTPEELASFYYSDEENMLYPMSYEPALGGSGSNDSVMFPVPYEEDDADGSTWTGAGLWSWDDAPPTTADREYRQ